MMSNEQKATHARVIRLKTEPTNSDKTIKQWTSEVLPLLKKQDGFRGATLVGNRKTGDGLSVTYWASDEAMKNARPKVRPQAETIMGQAGSKIVDEDECEVVVQERIQPAKAGVFVRVTTVETDLAKTAEGIAFYEEMIVPLIRKQPGARTALLFVNRKTGRGFAATAWDTEQDLQKSEAVISALRADAVQKFGGHDPKTEAFEIYFTEILAPASVR